MKVRCKIMNHFIAIMKVNCCNGRCQLEIAAIMKGNVIWQCGYRI